MRDIHNKDIAVVGVSEDESKYGHKIFKDLLKFQFKVYGVNLKGGEIFGRKIYRRLRDLPKIPDIVLTAVPPRITEAAVEECRTMGVKHIWMQPGSDSERAARLAEEAGITVTRNSCFMTVNGIWREAADFHSRNQRHARAHRK